MLLWYEKSCAGCLQPSVRLTAEKNAHSQGQPLFAEQATRGESTGLEQARSGQLDRAMIKQLQAQLKELASQLEAVTGQLAAASQTAVDEQRKVQVWDWLSHNYVQVTQHGSSSADVFNCYKCVRIKKSGAAKPCGTPFRCLLEG